MEKPDTVCIAPSTAHCVSSMPPRASSAATGRDWPSGSAASRRRSCRHGSGICEELLDELAGRTEEHGLHGFPAAQGAGGRLAGVRNNAGDLLLERNQAMRVAVLDVQHLTTLLGYLGRLAATRGDEQLAGFHARWEARLREVETDARDAAIEVGSEPAAAVVPADQGPLGRAGHHVANAVGTAGETMDASPVGRAARRFRR